MIRGMLCLAKRFTVLSKASSKKEDDATATVGSSSGRGTGRFAVAASVVSLLLLVADAMVGLQVAAVRYGTTYRHWYGMVWQKRRGRGG